MATRSGSVDPGALLYLLREHGLSRRRARPRARARVRARRARRARRPARLRRLHVPRRAGGRPRWRSRSAASTCSPSRAASARTAPTSARRSPRGSRFLGDFRVEVVPAREELVIARAVRRVLRSVVLRNRTRRLSGGRVGARDRRCCGHGRKRARTSSSATTARTPRAARSTPPPTSSATARGSRSWPSRTNGSAQPDDASPRPGTSSLARHVAARYLEPVGEPAEELVGAADALDADLVVVGRHADRDPATRARLASVAEVLRRALSCDVLVVQ